MSTFREYLEYEKNNLEPKEDAFLDILNKMDTHEKHERTDLVCEQNSNRSLIKSPFLGWSFGFVGISLASLMFFFYSNNPQATTPQVAVIKKEDVETLRQKTENTVKLIDSIDSFNVNNIK